jgi:hypothetical protein
MLTELSFDVKRDRMMKQVDPRYYVEVCYTHNSIVYLCFVFISSY